MSWHFYRIYCTYFLELSMEDATSMNVAEINLGQQQNKETLDRRDFPAVCHNREQPPNHVFAQRKDWSTFWMQRKFLLAALPFHVPPSSINF